MAKKDLSLIHSDSDEIVSINDRKKLNEIQEKFPKLEIIIGKATEDDKPISLDLAEMEHSRQRIFDAATVSIMGERIDRLMKPRKEPIMAYVAIIGFLAGVAACFYVYNI
jgi:hypothetical protein